jgi:hypothetical protein
VQIYERPSLLSTTFAGIVDQRVDPNNTLTWMNTQLGSVWHGPMEKNHFLLCGFVCVCVCIVCVCERVCGQCEWVGVRLGVWCVGELMWVCEWTCG